MNLTTAIRKDKSVLKFRTLLPQQTSKRARYPYEKLLTDCADKYLRKNHPGAKCSRSQLLRYQEIYDVAIYLQLSLEIFNHKNEETIIEVSL